MNDFDAEFYVLTDEEGNKFEFPITAFENDDGGEAKFVFTQIDKNGEEFANTVVLEDDEGEEIEFAMVGIIQIDGKEYMGLTPAEQADEENGDLIIVKMLPGGEIITIDDEEEDQYVGEAFLGCLTALLDMEDYEDE